MKNLIIFITLLLSFTTHAMIQDANDGYRGDMDGLQYIAYAISTTSITCIPTAIILKGSIDFTSEETISLLEVQANAVLNGESINSGENMIEALAGIFETTQVEMANTITNMSKNQTAIDVATLNEVFGAKLVSEALK